MKNNKIPVSDLPFSFDNLAEQYGDIVWAEMFCPGVYYIAVKKRNQHFLGCNEYLAVTDNSPAISAKGKSYGKLILTDPKVYLFDYVYSCKGRHVIEYEAYKYLSKHGRPLPYDDTLDAIQAFGKEVCPEYFGEFPVPTETPWGPPLRHDRLWNGLHWLETKEAGWVLAIAYPLCSDLWDNILELAVLNEYDRKKGINNTLGYYFYTYESSCLPIYEMIIFESETWGAKINDAALQNAVLKFLSVYDLGDIKNSPNLKLGQNIHFTKNVGTEFYHFS